MRNKNVDLIQKKKNELDYCMMRFNKTVNMITGAVKDLESINEDIDSKIQEIDNYEAELAKTKSGLKEVKGRNQNVIKNFNALIGA